MTLGLMRLRLRLWLPALLSSHVAATWSPAGGFDERLDVWSRQWSGAASGDERAAAAAARRRSAQPCDQPRFVVD